MPFHRMHRPKHIIEYTALQLLIVLVQRLPLRAAYGVGWLLAWPSHFLLRWRVTAALDRIRAVFGQEKSEQEVRRIAWRSWRNLCYNAVELMRSPRITRESLDQYFADPQGMLEAGQRAREKDQGMVLATAHLGNWDLAGVALHLLGLPMFFMARRQKNPLVDDLLVRMRGATGADTVLNDPGVLKNIIRRLRQGGHLAILPDVRNPTPGLRVSFLGGIANVGGGAAMFARHSRVPIFPIYFVRDGQRRMRWIALDAITFDPDADVESDRLRMTQELLSQLEEGIRRFPESYFWYNKRWVLDPMSPPSSSADA